MTSGFQDFQRTRVVLQVLLALLQSGCFSEGGVDVGGKCGPGDSTLDCCLKEHPGQWERCTGEGELEARKLSPVTKAVTGAMAVAVVASPVIIPVERRSVELATDLRKKVERAIEQCTREADWQVNDFHLDGASPSRELCEQIKVGEQKWSAYLGLLKHVEAWPCLREALEALVPGRYLLHPRFQLNPRTGRWEYMDPNLVSQVVHQQGWKGLTGTIEPDIVILDAEGVIILVYDMKFPCPESNLAGWDYYKGGVWDMLSQGYLYKMALQVKPLLVSPRYGVEPYVQER